MRQLTALDTQFLAMETDATHGHVSALTVLDPSCRPSGELTLEDVRALMRQRLHLLPPFRWRLAEVPLGIDYPYWLDDPDFDLDYHVREIALPAPGCDEQLAEQASRIIATRLDRARPLWELYLVQGLAGGRVGVVTKVHHALIDGVSGAEIMAVLLDIAPEGRPLGDPPAVVRDRKPAMGEMLLRGLKSMPLQPWRAARGAVTAVPNLDQTPFRVLPGAHTASAVARRATAPFRRSSRALITTRGSTVRSPATVASRSARCRSTTSSG
jgi:diacylglycerol O-acyltransferase